MRAEILKCGSIRDLRNDRGLTREDVAKILPISQNTYSRDGIRITRYPLNAVVTLAEYCGVSVEDLVALKDETDPYLRRKHDAS